MFQAINTKLLLSILAALIAIGSLLVHQHEENKRAAAILEQQQQQRQQQEERDREFTAKVNELKKKQNTNATDKHDAWKNYLP